MSVAGPRQTSAPPRFLECKVKKLNKIYEVLMPKIEIDLKIHSILNTIKATSKNLTKRLKRLVREQIF
jgi:hypothetical protein